MTDSLFSSPARSIGDRSLGDPNSLTDSEYTDCESESLELATEVPGLPEQTIVDGWVKFRDNRKWKQRWGVVTKLSPAADCLHLQLYRDSKDRYKQGQTKASLSLQHFLGVETGFTLDKESNTIAIICQDVTVVLAFDTRERLIQWQVKITCHLGDGIQFLVLVSQSPPKAKIHTGPARIHVQEYKFCMTTGVPPRLIGCWEVAHLRRYGVVEGRFCFEGGSRCGKGEGLYVLVTDQGADITEALQMSAQGKVVSKRKQIVRKSSIMDSPRKSLHSRQEDDTPSVIESDHRSNSPFWSMESRRTEIADCGDTASVHVHVDETRGLPSSMERCVSCISKLGAPSMSRSSTANTATFAPAWTMEGTPCTHQWDGLSMSSHGTGSSSGGSEYSVPRQICTDPPLPPKTISSVCNCSNCPPTRPPKSTALTMTTTTTMTTKSPCKPKPKKPPMPLPTAEESEKHGNAYDNYDVPRNYLSDSNNKDVYVTSEYYDTPKSILENLSSTKSGMGNYDTPPPAKTMRKPCGCVVTFARQAVDVDNRVECPCQRVMCWAENWMFLPYCRRGHGVDTNVGIQKVKLSGQGKMPVMNASGEVAIYAMVDKTKKMMKKSVGDLTNDSNYENINTIEKSADINYENIDFTQSLEYYENAKDILSKVGLGKISETVNGDCDVNKVCAKCGHLSQAVPHSEQKCQEDYLLMDPNRMCQGAKPHSGYLPMFPSNRGDVLKLLANRGLSNEKSASISSLPCAGTTAGGVGKNRENRIPGSAMMVMPPFRRLLDGEDVRRFITSRKRSSSADSSRYLEEFEELESRTSSPASPHRIPNKPTSNSLSSLPYQSPKKIVLSEESLPPLSAAAAAAAATAAAATTTATAIASATATATTTATATATATVMEPSEEEICEKTICEEVAESAVNEDDCSSSGSLQTLVHESSADAPAGVHIRRSSSVPCKSGNRDSSSSNDSGVSTGSLKQRGRDFTEFELPLTTAQSSRRHQSTKQNCLHFSLPRKSKSSDPLRELSFQFQMTRIPAKSSSAEAEVPICSIKKGYFSPNDGTPMPYMDSRSTSSGTSDMSDYFETLSLSSYSSSDAAENFNKMNRIAVTTLRPRSGSEYLKIDRSVLTSNELVTKSTQLGNFPNIGPLPEKSESPSPGYESGSSGREVQCNNY